MSTQARIAAIQMNCRLGDISANLAQAEVPAAAGETSGPTVTRLCELAADLDLAPLAGLAEWDPFITGLLYDSVVSECQPAPIMAELDLNLMREQRLQEPILRGFRPALDHFHNS